MLAAQYKRRHIQNSVRATKSGCHRLKTVQGIVPVLETCFWHIFTDVFLKCRHCRPFWHFSPTTSTFSDQFLAWTLKSTTSKSMFCFHHLSPHAMFATEFSVRHPVTQPWQCHSQQTCNTTGLKCGACCAKSRWKYPKCRVWHKNFNLFWQPRSADHFGHTLHQVCGWASVVPELLWDGGRPGHPLACGGRSKTSSNSELPVFTILVLQFGAGLQFESSGVWSKWPLYRAPCPCFLAGQFSLSWVCSTIWQHKRRLFELSM